MLEDVTIIIPAHNRPERLRRLLGYYAATGARIIVADSSDAEFSGAYDPATTLYRHFPGMHFLLKLREVLPFIRTPYVLYCADDDFAVPAGIQAVTRFLDAHPTYSVAQGHYLTFTPRRGGKVKFTPRYIRHFASRIDADDAPVRLSDPTPQYATWLYGVVRSDVFKRMYSFCFDSDNGRMRFTNLFLAEEFFCKATLMYGRYATVPCFYSARECIPGSATTFTVPKRTVMTAPEYRDEYEGYLDALTDVLLDCCPQLSREQAAGIVRQAERLPADVRDVALKRRIVEYCHRRPLLRPIARLLDYRYARKGFKAVQGMSSYPCRILTPDIADILAAINSTHS